MAAGLAKLPDLLTANTLGDQPAVGRRLLSSRGTRRAALKGNLMAEPEVEAAWRAEFKRIGEKQLRDALNSGAGIADEPKRRAAFRWLGDEGEERRLREERTHHYVRWTFFAGIAAVIVGLIGVGLTFLH
jgi:hypothetical protein